MITRVLPEPAAASTSIGPVKCSTASLCAGLREGGDLEGVRHAAGPTVFKHGESQGASLQSPLGYARAPDAASSPRARAFRSLRPSPRDVLRLSSAARRARSGPRAAPGARPAPPDLSPTPEPDGLIVFARVAKPSEAIKVIGGWVQMPMPGAAEVGQLRGRRADRGTSSISTSRSTSRSRCTGASRTARSPPP